MPKRCADDVHHTLITQELSCVAIQEIRFPKTDEMRFTAAQKFLHLNEVFTIGKKDSDVHMLGPLVDYCSRSQCMDQLRLLNLPQHLLLGHTGM